MIDTKCKLKDVLLDWFNQTDFSSNEGKSKIMLTLEKDLQFMLRVYGN